MIAQDKKGLFHPKNEHEIATLVKQAIAQKKKVRVRGAALSVDDSIAPQDSNVIVIQLDQIRDIEFDDANMRITVGAGCNFAFDPFDPSGTSNVLNGLYRQIDQKGWALENIPDAAMQTVGGFISTGSSGPSLQHSFDDCICSISLVDGTGSIKTFDRSGKLDDEFYGIGSSMGLMGVIYEVTLQCVPAFDIVGDEKVTDVEDCPYDFFGNGSKGRPSLEEHLTNTEYARTMWWPFHTLHRAVSWEARTMQPGDYSQKTGKGETFVPKPYVPVFPKILGSRVTSELVASTGFSLISSWPDWLYILLGKSPKEVSPEIQAGIMLLDKVAPYLYPLLINMYFPKNSASHPPQEFWDHWLGSLPMDSFEFSNKLMNLDYTELWFPIEMTQEVVSILQAYYDKNGASATGFYTLEVLASKKSPFWMSPGHNQDSIRLNFMYFATDAPSPDDFYYQFYDMFKKKGLPFRMHWGKYLPDSNLSQWSGYLQSQYSEYDKFAALRKKMDPNDLFVTSYWAGHLGL